MNEKKRDKNLKIALAISLIISLIIVLVSVITDAPLEEPEEPCIVERLYWDKEKAISVRTWDIYGIEYRIISPERGERYIKGRVEKYHDLNNLEEVKAR